MNSIEPHPIATPPSPPFRFSLRTLLLLVVVLGSSLMLAIVGWLVLHLLVAHFVAPPRSHAELKEQAEIAMKETGGTDVLAKEAKAILSNFRARPRSIEGWDNVGYVDVSNGGRYYPAIVKLYSLLSPYGHDPWVVADQKRLPAHVVIRFGSHAHYAYIWMFDPADMPLRKIEGVEHLSGAVYLAEKNE